MSDVGTAPQTNSLETLLAKLQKDAGTPSGATLAAAPPQPAVPDMAAPQDAETQDDPAATQAPVAQPPGLLQRAIDAVRSLGSAGGEEPVNPQGPQTGEAGTGIVAGLARAPVEVVKGIGGTVGDLTPNAAKPAEATVGNWLSKEGALSGGLFGPMATAVGATLLTASGGLDTKSSGDQNTLLAADHYLSTIGDSSFNQGAATLGSLVLGAEGVDEARLFAFAPKLIKGALNFGTASSVLTDPDSARLSSSLKALGVDTEFTNWLGADPSEAGHWENRLKNGLENTLTGAGFDMAFTGLKYLKSVLTGAPDLAAKQAAIDAAKTAIPEPAHPEESAVSVDRRTAATAVTVTDQSGNSRVAATIPKENFNDLVQQAESTRGSGVEPPDDAEQGAGGATGSNPAGAAPLPPLGDANSVIPTLRAVSQQLHDTPHVVRPDAERAAFAQKVAADVGLDPVDMMAYARSVAGNVDHVDSAIQAIGAFWGKIAGDIDKFAAIGVDALHPEDSAKLVGSIENVINFTSSTQTIRSGMGRGLRSLSNWGHNGGPSMDEALAHEVSLDRPVPPVPRTNQEIKDWLELWNSTKDDPAGRQNFLRGVSTLPGAFKYLRTSFANMFTANALAGMPSISMNAVGPGMVAILQTMEKSLGGYTASLFAKDAATAAALRATSNNAIRYYAQTMSQLGNAFRYAKQAAKEDRSILGGGWTVDVGRMGPVTPGMIRASGGDTVLNRGTYAIGNLINVWPRAFQKVNAGLDEFAHRLSYMGEVQLGAHVDGVQQGLSGQELKSYVRAKMESSIDQETGHATDETALWASGRATMTNPLQSDFHPEISKWATRVQEMRKELPETRFILPVFNVPANSLGETLRRVPVLNFLFSETRAELAGELGPMRQADAYGRTMLGAAWLLYGFHLARAGLMTGPGPSDPHDNALWQQTHQPYSIRVGDKWVNYSRYDLPGGLLGITGALYDKTVNQPQDKAYSDSLLGATAAFAQYFKDKAALQGVSDLMDFGATPQSADSYATRLGGNLLSRGLVPNFVTQLGRNTTDNEKRIQVTPGDYLMNALPGFSKELDPMRNVMGEPIHVPRDTLLENLMPITIAPATTFKTDPELAEVSRVYEKTGYAAGVTHQADISNGFFDARSIKLENGRSLYDAIIKSRTQVSDATGQSLRQALKDMIGSDTYKEAKDADAGALVSSTGEVSRGALLARVFGLYEKLAIQKVAADSPTAKRWLAIASAKKHDSASLSAYSAQRLHDAPGIFKALGIDLSGYEDTVSAGGDDQTDLGATGTP